MQWYYGQKCHFPSTICIPQFFGHIEEFKKKKTAKLVVILGKKRQLALKVNKLSISNKITVRFKSVNFFVMCASLWKTENHAETPILKDIFIFVATGHCFEKCYFLVEISSFLKEVFSVFSF